jgi:hypothetical protein
MRARRSAAAVARAAGVLAAALCLGRPAAAAPVSPEEMARLCANVEGPAHCGRVIEETQLKRLPNLAVRDGTSLKVLLYPAGTATFADTEAANGGRSYSLWDYVGSINAVLLYTTDGDSVTFTLLQRTNGRRTELPTEPRVSPDRQWLVTADFCPTRCVNELAVWRVTREGVRKEYEWKPREAWSDAGATWKDADTLLIEFTSAATGKSGTLERRIADPDWVRSP